MAHVKKITILDGFVEPPPDARPPTEGSDAAAEPATDATPAPAPETTPAEPPSSLPRSRGRDLSKPAQDDAKPKDA